MFPEPLRNQTARLIARCRDAGVLIAAAESCTGGLLGALITTIPGSSEVFDRGFVTYSNAAKIECLGVPPHILETFGAVSRETALAMAAGALAHSNASIAIAITGIAGPGGGTSEKPVGLVHFGFARNGGEPSAVEKHFGALDREGVRSAAIAAAMDLLLEAVH
jgi:nicotinamide-nucleotide amidase